MVFCFGCCYVVIRHKFYLIVVLQAVECFFFYWPDCSAWFHTCSYPLSHYIHNPVIKSHKSHCADILWKMPLPTIFFAILKAALGQTHCNSCFVAQSHHLWSFKAILKKNLFNIYIFFCVLLWRYNARSCFLAWPDSLLVPLPCFHINAINSKSTLFVCHV